MYVYIYMCGCKYMEIEMPILYDSPGALREVQLYHVEHIDPRPWGFNHRHPRGNGSYDQREK